jgi:hypothetical protein
MQRFLLTLAIACSVFSFAFADPVEHTESQSPLPASVVRSDLAFLYSTLTEAHYDLFAHRSKVEYDRYYRELDAGIRAPMTRTQAAVLFQRFVAYGRIGHARIDAPLVQFVSYLKSGGKLLPIFIRVDGRRVFLTEPAERTGTLVAGTEIIALAGQPIDAVLDRLSAYVSSERPYMTYTQMEESFPALLWMDLGPVDSVKATGIVDGKHVDVRVSAMTLDERRALGQKFPVPTLTTDFAARGYRMLGDGIAYLRPGPFFNITKSATGAAPSYDASEFRAFIDESFLSLLASNASDLLIDLRKNPGGDNSFSDPLVAWFATRSFRFASSFKLKASAATKDWYARQRSDPQTFDPEVRRMSEVEAKHRNGSRYVYDLPLVAPRAEPRFHGRVWVLVDRHSYSNATSVAALVQDYGFGTIIGEETADVASNYASVLSFDLPKTGITVTYPKSHFVRPNGRDDVSGVTPDVPLKRAPIGVAEDVVLQEATRYVREEAARAETSREIR